MNSVVAVLVSLGGLIAAVVVIWKLRSRERSFADQAVDLAKQHRDDVVKEEARIIAYQQEQTVERLNEVARLAREEARRVAESDDGSVADRLNELKLN